MAEDSGKSPSDGYFAASSADDLGSKLIGKVEAYSEHHLVRQVDSRLFSAWQYYFGYSPDGFHATSIVGRGGEQGELAEIRINHGRALVNALLNLIVAPKFVWTPRAANIDYDTVRQTELAAAVLEHYWHNKKVSKFACQAVEEAIAFTEGFILTEWDDLAGALVPGPGGQSARTGDLRFTNLSSWDVIRDPDKKSWDELDWVIVKLWRNKYELAARFPDKSAEILALGPDDLGDSQNSRDDKWNSDDVPLFIFYHKPNAVLPFGREVHFVADGTVVKDEALEFDQFPLHRVSPSELIGTPYGYSAFLEILGIQEMQDSIHSSIATNISTFAAQCIAAEEGQPLNVDDIAGGMKVIYHGKGQQPPQPLQLTKVPPEAFKYVSDLKSFQELLMGLNAVVRGEAQSDKMSGAALALLQSQALQQASALQGSYVRMLESMGSMVIQIIKAKATAALKVAIVGKHQLGLVQEAEVDKDSVAGVEQVFVELGNPISQTAAGRFELGQLLVQMKMVKSPEELQMVFDTGRLDPLTKSSQEELLNILRENQDISEGTQPVAMIQDNHLLHGKEHSTPVASPSARRDPKVVQAFTQHMQEHYSLFYGVPLQQVPADPLYRERMLLLLGQTPPPPMAPPAPPGSGMPPPGGPMPPPPGVHGGPPPGPPGPAPTPPKPGPNGPLAPPPGALGPSAPVNMPNMPTNPMTGKTFNNFDGGGQVPR